MSAPILLQPASVRVMLHGFTEYEYEPGKFEQTYAEPHEAEGWCVWVRIERPADFEQPHDSIGEERDFIFEDDAHAYAEQLARDLHAEIMEY